MKKRICFFNQSPIHYRKAIYELMDKELDVDFYFGDKRSGGIAPYDASLLKHNKGTLHNINIGPFYWQKGALSLLKSDYDVLLTPGDINCLSTWLIIILSRLYKKQVYTWTHGAYGKEGWLRRLAIRFRAKRLSGVFLYGNYAKGILQGYGINPNKLFVIYNSLNYDEQYKLRNEIGISDIFSTHFGNSNKNIVFVGRLTKVKKLNLLLSAISLLQEKGIHYNVTFIGDGDEKDNLMSIQKHMGIDNIWYYGACYDEKELAQLLYNADLCVSPGNVGLTAMHSMAFGTPVVSHNNLVTQMPEVEAIESGKTGLYFAENDSHSLADAIESWFSLGLSRDEVRQNCYAVIDQKYNPHIQVQTIKSALEL